MDKEATLQLYNTLITDNTATALGGGIWACRTGDVKIYVTEGGAVYDNNTIGESMLNVPNKGAGDDIAVYVQGGILGALLGDGYLKLSPSMLGGGANHYYKDGGVTDFDKGTHTHHHREGPGLGAPDGTERYDKNGAVLCTDTEIKDAVALKNVVSPMAKASAERAAKLIISGNSASRGAGIGTNGNLVIGRSDEEPETGSLTISKTVSGSGASTEKLFTFTVKLTDQTGAPISEWFAYSGASTVDGVTSPESGMLTFNEDGQATIQLSHGQSITIVGLPEGAAYTVTESDNDGYTVTATGAEGKIENDKTAEVKFINYKDKQTGNLTVSKTVSGSGADISKAFTFTVTLSDKTISETYGDMTFENGVAIFKLKHGESKTATGLPAGITYSVVESDNDGYTVTATGAEGKIENDKTAEVKFINHKPGGGGGGSDNPPPEDPKDPEEPEEPEEPTTPEEPDTPDEPTTPEEPGTPDEPGTPEEPNIPSEQGNPDDPEYGLDDSDVPKGGADAPEDGTIDGAPRTGDTAPTAVFAVLLLTAAGGFAINL